MANLNKAQLIGNLTRDPEIKYTPKGTAVAQISLAINRRYTNDSGEKLEETTFVDVELWGRTAEVAGEFLKKGSSCYIEGRLKMDSWEDKTTGQKRSKMKVVADGLQLLGGRGGGTTERPEADAAAERQASRPKPTGAPKPPADPALDVPEDDGPF